MKLPAKHLRVKDAPEGSPTARASGGAGGTLYVNGPDLETLTNTATFDHTITVDATSTIYWVVETHSGLPSGSIGGFVRIDLVKEKILGGTTTGYHRFLDVWVSNGDTGKDVTLSETITTVDAGEWTFRSDYTSATGANGDIQCVSVLFVMDDCAAEVMTPS